MHKSVEIDECKLVKKKNHRGRNLVHQKVGIWGIERDTNGYFYEFVDRRDLQHFGIYKEKSYARVFII